MQVFPSGEMASMLAWNLLLFALEAKDGQFQERKFSYEHRQSLSDARKGIKHSGAVYC